MNIHTNKTSNGAIDGIYHVITTVGNNSAGVPWCDCVKECDDYPKFTTALQDDDLKDIEKGAIIEVCERYIFSRRGLSDEDKWAELEARYTVVSEKTITDMHRKLKYYGYEDDV